MPETRPRVLSLAEANAALPRAQSLLERLLELQEIIVESAEAQEALTRQLKVGEGAARGKVMDELHAGLARQDQLTAEAESAFREMGELGAMVKSLESGLIDFYGLRGGETVLLCWQLGEAPRISHWHTLDGGFAGRQPVDHLVK
jgi:hypothetical protein